jgi:hypothetical protein
MKMAKLTAGMTVYGKTPPSLGWEQCWDPECVALRDPRVGWRTEVGGHWHPMALETEALAARRAEWDPTAGGREGRC